MDEANLTGHPEDADWAVEPLNHIFDSIVKKAAIHMCFGNYGGQTIQEGTLEQDDRILEPSAH